MRAHVIEDGKVVNTIEVQSLDFLPNLVDAEQGGRIGDLWDGQHFTVPGTDLASLKAAKNEEINRWREEANKLPFPYLGKHIAVDDLSMKDILSTASYIGMFGVFHPEFPGGWKTVENTYIPMPAVADFKAMFSAMTDQGTANFSKSQQLKAQLAAATTAEQVAAIVW